jgi:LacI family transcriptional regulator
MVTIKEVAREAGVSIGTVSNVVTGSVPVSVDRRGRVEIAIRKLGYHPNHVARSLKLRRTKMLGMVISDITNPFFSQMVRGAEDAALERNYLLLTFNTDDRIEREKQVLAVLRSRRVDGILLVVAPSAGRPSHIQETIKARTPIVCLDRVPPGIRVDCVSVDNAAAARDCVRHLLTLGHRRIGIITGSMALQTAQERLQGYKNALAEAGIPIKPEWIREGDFHAESGYRRGRELLMTSDRPTALFISNNLMAIGVLKALAELGLRCPRDVAIATFDDMPVAEVFQPHLTAVAQPAYSIGYKGADLLIQRIEADESNSNPVQIRFPTELKIRESTIGYKLRSSPRLARARPSATH